MNKQPMRLAEVIAELGKAYLECGDVIVRVKVANSSGPVRRIEHPHPDYPKNFVELICD